MINFNRFGISTPQSLSSYHRRNFMNNIQSTSQCLKHHDLQIWFSVILWMPCFLNDKRYNFYWLIEKILLRVSLIIILIFVIYTETKCALHLIPITTSIRCVLEIINLLNLIPFVIYDDPDFDNIAELYSSRELSTAITRKKRTDIVKEVNKCYYNYLKNIAAKLSQQSLNNNNNINNNNNNNRTTKIYQSAGSNKSGHQQLLLLTQTGQSHSFGGLTPAPSPKIAITNNVQDFNHIDDGSTEYEEDEDDDDNDDDSDDDDEYEDETEDDNNKHV